MGILKSVFHNYLLCLLELGASSAKYPQITSVPHGRSAKTYAGIIEGRPPPLLELEDIDVESEAGGGGDLAIEDAPELEVDEDDDADVANSDTASQSNSSARTPGGASGDEAAPIMVVSGVVFDDDLDPAADLAGDIDVEEDVGAGGADPAADLAGDIVVEEDVGAGGADAMDVEPAGAPVLGAFDLSVNHHWGVFRVTVRRPTETSFGSWFVRCPFHRLNEKTSCTRTIGITGPTVDDRRFALYSLYTWCNAAREHVRKSDHRAHPLPVVAAEIMPYDVLVAQHPHRSS